MYVLILCNSDRAYYAPSIRLGASPRLADAKQYASFRAASLAGKLYGQFEVLPIEYAPATLTIHEREG